MSAVNCTRTATAGHILVSVSRFDYIAAQIAVDSILIIFTVCVLLLQSYLPWKSGSSYEPRRLVA